MTCVIGLTHDKRVYMAADSATAVGWEVLPMTGKKIFRIGDMLIGVAGNHSVGQLVRYIKMEKHLDDISDEEYLLNVVLVDIRKCLKDHGKTKIENSVEELSSEMLVAYHSRLYKIGADCSLLELTSGLQAIGAGREYALGAMLALADKPPCERLLRSLEYVAMICACVCAPFVIEDI